MRRVQSSAQRALPEGSDDHSDYGGSDALGGGGATPSHLTPRGHSHLTPRGGTQVRPGGHENLKLDEETAKMGEYRRKTAMMTEEKARKLQQLTALSHQTSQNHSNIDESNKRRADHAKKAEALRTYVDEIAAAVKAMSAKYDANEQKGREIEHKMAELESRQEMHIKGVEAAINDTNDKFTAKLKSEEDGRVRLGQELQQILNLREKKINQTMLNEVNEEANARIAVANDCAKMVETMKDLKASLSDECSKMQARIASLQTKNSGQLSDIGDLINAERTTRERSIVACNNMTGQKLVEMKCLLEAKCKELNKEQKGAANQLTFLLDGLRQDFSKSGNKRDQLLDLMEKKCFGRMDTMDSDGDKKLKDVKLYIENQLHESNGRLSDLRSDVVRDRETRKSELCGVKEALAEEHLHRETDEAAIINMLENMMKQVKNMNSADCY